MSKLPVSVIVPHKKSRKEFFEGYCLPSIEANHPEEIIIIDEEGSAAMKRNKGARLAKSEYLFFCDDDNILDSKCLQENLQVLQANPDISFSYNNFLNVCVYQPKPRGRQVFLCNPIEWNPEILLQMNYIDTGSLIRKKAFMEFDEELPKYEDWEMWIRMMKAGRIGVYTKKVLYISFKIDPSISFSVPDEPAFTMIEKKHPEVKIWREDDRANT